MKIELELVIHEEPDGRKFLNYWDYMRGQDVCCQIIDGGLYIMDEDSESGQEITLGEFVRLVEQSVNNARKP